MGDDDKIYFFFTETGKELNFFENPLVSRIARVCKVRIRFNFCLGDFFGWFDSDFLKGPHKNGLFYGGAGSTFYSFI